MMGFGDTLYGIAYIMGMVGIIVFALLMIQDASEAPNQCTLACEDLGKEYYKAKGGFSNQCWCREGNETVKIYD